MSPRAGTSGWRRLLSTLAAVAAGSLISVLTFDSAYAAVTDNMFRTPSLNYNCSNSSEGGQFCQTDNRSLTAHRRPGEFTSAGLTNIATALQNANDATVLDVIFVGDDVVYSGGAETDIIYTQGALSGSTIGTTWCDARASDTACDQHWVKLESATPPVGLACHETGHAVGLTHGSNASPPLASSDARLACMVTPYTPDKPFLGNNNVDNINVTY